MHFFEKSYEATLMMKGINFSNKKVKVTIHVLMWILIFLLPYILYKANDRPPSFPKKEDARASFLYLPILTDFLWIGVFYLNALILIPRLFNRKKFLLYFLSAVGIFFLVIAIHGVLFKLLTTGRTFKLLNAVVFSLAPFFLSLAASAVWEMWNEKSRADKKAREKQQENLKTELSFLRSQISPHFVFNILNNITALIRMKSDLAEPAIMKLSSLMQYMLYETDQERVLLKTEVAYLESYIDLQKQRFGKRVSIQVYFDLENEWAEIEPMLLIPFVENAFKHGVGMISKPHIDISLRTRQDVLYFDISNKYNPDSHELKDKTSGIGLANVKRRIELLYSDRFSLEVSREDEIYHVSLSIHLHV